MGPIIVMLLISAAVAAAVIYWVRAGQHPDDRQLLSRSAAHPEVYRVAREHDEVKAAIEKEDEESSSRSE